MALGSMALHSADFSWLSWLLLLLLLGAGITLIISATIARWFALAVNLLAFIVALIISIGFDSRLQGFQYIEKYTWIRGLNIHYFLGIDGISVLFLPATTLLFTAIILASWNSINKLRNLYFALLLILECSILGVFVALDTIVFILFWEISLIPLFFLITLWGVGANRRYAGVKYVLFMMGGGLALLFAFVLLALGGETGNYVFSYPELVTIANDNQYQTIIFFLLLFGFGVKTPLFPMHTWLPVLAQEGHPASVASIVGLKLGAYGLLRFTLPLAPDAAQSFQSLMVGLGLIAVVYGSIAALNQSNIRRMLAFSSLSHVGLIVIALATMSQQGIQGAMFQLLNFTMVAGGLFLLTGFLYQRIGSTDVVSLGGIAKTMPLLTSFFFFLALANIGVPATSGFPAELLLILSALGHYTGIGIAVLFGIILSAAYILELFRKSFLGQCRNQAILDAQDLKKREILIALIICFIVLFFGLFPQLILETMDVSTQNWVSLMTKQ